MINSIDGITILRPATKYEIDEVRDWEGTNTDYDTDLHDWYYCEVDPKVFSRPMYSFKSEGAHIFNDWQQYWEDSLADEENEFRDLESLESHWRHNEDVIKDSFLTMVIKDNLLSLEDGWHRAAVAVIYNMPKVYALIGVPKE